MLLKHLFLSNFLDFAVKFQRGNSVMITKYQILERRSMVPRVLSLCYLSLVFKINVHDSNQHQGISGYFEINLFMLRWPLGNLYVYRCMLLVQSWASNKLIAKLAKSQIPLRNCY